MNAKKDNLPKNSAADQGVLLAESVDSSSLGKLRNRQAHLRLLGYLYPYRARFALALMAMTVYGITDGAIPYLLKRILDDVFGSQDEMMLRYLVAVIVAFAAVRGVFGYFQKYLAAGVGLDIIKDIRTEIDRKLLSCSPSFYQHSSTGSLISRVTNDTLLVCQALTDAAAALVRDSIRVVALLVVAFYLDPVLASIAIIGFPLGLIPVIKYGKKVRKLSRLGQDQFGGLTSILQETIIGHKVIQAFTKEKHELSRFQVENEKFTETYRRAEKYGALSGPTNEFLGSVAIALVILYGGFSVISGVRTQGDFIAFITALFLLYEPLKKLSRINNVMQTGLAAAERIFELLDLVPDIIDHPNAVELAVVNPTVTFENVFFSYDAPPSSTESEVAVSRPWVLDDISFTVQPGETLALVGMSGGGKSTLVNLLPRFYDIQSGTIKIDQQSIYDVTLESLRRHISIVSQHTFLFNDTIYHNIAYGALNPSVAEVEAAAKAANAHEFILRMPQGYQTIVGEQGLKLSGGQRARLAIARALLKDSPILILDEATASLDSESEELVQEAVQRLMKGRTVLVIAHRLATIRQADKIAVVSHGRIAEIGRHEELLKLGGDYEKLYRLQFRDSVNVEFRSAAMHE